MRGRIHRHRVRVRRAILARCRQRLSALVEHRDDAGLARHVEAVQSRVQREHVRVVADAVGAGRSHGAQVDRQQLRVALAGDERHAVRLVDQEPVRVVARHLVAGDHAVARRVDGGELVPGLHRDHDAARDGVVVRVPGLPAERDRRHAHTAPRVDRDVRLARLVGDVHLSQLRDVRDAVREDVQAAGVIEVAVAAHDAVWARGASAAAASNSSTAAARQQV